LSHSILNKFDRLTKTGDGWTALCPAHEDKARSLSLKVSNGKVLFNCFAGCTAEAVAAAKGLTMADLRVEQSAAAPTRITVESLADIKGLPVQALTRYGVKAAEDVTPAERLAHGIGGRSGIWIPYFNADGTITARTRLRMALRSKDKPSYWLKGGFGAIQPYGLHDLADAREQRILVICEGESDYWTLRHAKIPALGIPGAQMFRTLQRGHLAGIDAVYVTQDSGAAGATFVAGVLALVSAWGLTGAYAVPMPDGCQDVNDFYRKDPAGFAGGFLALMQRAADAGTPPVREFSTAAGVYVLTVPEWGIRLELDQIRRPWGDLNGELAVMSDATGDISRGTVNLSNVDKRQAAANQLTKRSGMPEVDWPALMDDFAMRCLRAERTSGVVVDLRDVPLPSPESSWDIGQFRLSREDATCLFGDGGTGKSLIALNLVGILARQGVNVLYIDAEWKDGIHKERLVSLFGDGYPSVKYLEQRAPLALVVDQIRRHIAEHQIQYLVLDSVGLLTVGAPEEAGAALGYSRAVQSLGVGSLSLAHIRKPQGMNDIRPQEQKPFGSVFYHNLFRRTYFVKAEEDAPEGGKRLVVWNPKWNHRGRGQQPFGLQFTEDGERTEIREVEAAQVDGLADKLPIWQRIRDLLRRGPLTVEAIAEELDVPEKGVTSALSKGKAAGRFAKQFDNHGSPWQNA
jgi:AAA domain-containing protein/CHC2-type zinc finger protein